MSSYLLSWLWRAIETMIASLAGLGRIAHFAAATNDDDDPDSIRVFVQSRGQRIPLRLDRGWTIAHVKNRLSAALRLPPEEIKVILAGQSLADDVKVGDCDLGQSTVLHAVKIVHENKEAIDEAAAAAAAPLNHSLLDLQLSEGEKRELIDEAEKRRYRAHFYVYCAAEACGGGELKPGKLRARCAGCGQDAILVDRDPAEWRDVLEPERIYGECHSGLCSESNVNAVQFYFKCSAGHAGSEPTPPLYMIRANIHSVSCLACGDDRVDPVLVFDCADQHAICVECFVAYCGSRLGERQFTLDNELGYTLPCAIGCDSSLIKERRHFKLLGKTDYDRYLRFGAEEVVLQNGGVLCPQPGCGMGIMQEEQCRRIVCGGCSYVFCRECLQGYHIGECADAAAVGGGTEDSSPATQFPHGDRSRWGANSDPSRMAIRLTTKPCPQCRTPTERSGGCMHMICTKAACGFQWCWICQTEWTRECMASHWFG